MPWDASLIPPRRRLRRCRRTRRPRPRWLPTGGSGGTPQYSTWTESARGIVWTESNRGISWSAPTMTILTKRAAESRRYTMDLSNLPEFAAGDTIASVTYVHCTTAVGTGGSTTDLTLGTISMHAGNKGVDVIIGAGIDGVTYTLAFAVLTVAGYTLVGIAYLYIDDR
jgi:hypothetical protein